MKKYKKSFKSKIKNLFESKHTKNLIKGIYAGVMIGIGGIVYLSLDNKIAGSFFFSIGLLTICMYGMNLYTGKIGYILINKKDYLIELLLSLVGNLIGTFTVGKMMLYTRFATLQEKALILSNQKLDDSLISIFILSIFCGILMYIAVNNYKKINNEIGKYAGIFMCVMVFILCGFEHCVANMVYFTVAEVYSAKAFLYLLIMILGNSVGSIFIAAFYNMLYKN
ncbi:MAG: formate/nitrite transporter family protein [Bacilli bacterium]|nr:formate/nitrite transporter family protein [Bacilli bacterium]